jgi:membrane protease YdiL (CAAX protease family)
MKKSKVFIYLTIAFIWSWTNWFIGLHYLSQGITDQTYGQFVKYFFIGVYGPTIGAVITTFYFGGFKGLLDLFKKLLIWKVPIKIYLTVVFLPLLFLVSGLGLYAIFVGNIGRFDWNAGLAIPGLLWSALFAGPLGEELGWRGLMLPELQKKYSAFISSLIVGLFWYSWHIPLFWAPFGTLVSGDDHSVYLLFIYLTIVACLSCINAWLINNSRGSVLITILFHLSVNAGIALLFFPELKDHYKQLYLFSTPVIILFTIYLGLRTRFNKKQALINR